MARGPSTRVVLNRSKIEAVRLAVADGVFEVGKAIIEAADPPDATPYGVGLVQQGGAIAYVDGKKVAGWSLQGNQPKPPRAAHVSRTRGTMVIAGFGFPGRFVEKGTVNMAAEPFLTPASNAVLPNAAAIMAPVVRPKLGGR